MISYIEIHLRISKIVQTTALHYWQHFFSDLFFTIVFYDIVCQQILYPGFFFIKPIVYTSPFNFAIKRWKNGLTIEQLFFSAEEVIRCHLNASTIRSYNLIIHFVSYLESYLGTYICYLFTEVRKIKFVLLESV